MATDRFWLLSVSLRSSPDSTGCLNGVDILKVHCSDPHLIVQLKFCQQEKCLKFLQSYREGAFQESLQRHLKVSLCLANPVSVETELKTGTKKLDAILREEEQCLECICQDKVMAHIQAGHAGRLQDGHCSDLRHLLFSMFQQMPEISINFGLSVL